jgi:hypothetical protein
MAGESRFAKAGWFSSELLAEDAPDQAIIYISRQQCYRKGVSAATSALPTDTHITVKVDARSLE